MSDNPQQVEETRPTSGIVAYLAVIGVVMAGWAFAVARDDSPMVYTFAACVVYLCADLLLLSRKIRRQSSRPYGQGNASLSEGNL